MTIVHYDYKPKRAGRQKPAVDFPCGRIVSARNAQAKALWRDTVWRPG